MPASCARHRPQQFRYTVSARDRGTAASCQNFVLLPRDQALRVARASSGARSRCCVTGGSPRSRVRRRTDSGHDGFIGRQGLPGRRRVDGSREATWLRRGSARAPAPPSRTRAGSPFFDRQLHGRLEQLPRLVERRDAAFVGQRSTFLIEGLDAALERPAFAFGRLPQHDVGLRKLQIAVAASRKRSRALLARVRWRGSARRRPLAGFARRSNSLSVSQNATLQAR